MASKTVFVGQIIGRDGRGQTDTVLARDWREARRILLRRHAGFGGQILDVTPDAGFQVGRLHGGH